MHVLWKALVYDAAAQPEDRRVAFFDGMLRLESGTWLCGFTAGRTKHHHEGTIRLCRSRDGGESWNLLSGRFQSKLNDKPGSLAGAEIVEVELGRQLLFTTWFDRSDPERPLFDPETEGILRSRQLVAESRDEGDTWSDWRTVPTPGLTGTAITGPVLRWSDGTIAFAFESFKEFDDPRTATHGAWLVASRDGGQTFEPPHLVARDPQQQLYFWDQRLCAGQKPGDYFGFFWTHDRSAKRDLNVHLLRGNLLQPESARQQPLETTIQGQIAAPLLLADGRLLAFVVDRNRPGTMRLWSSPDGGTSWPAGDCLTVHQHDEQARLSQGSENIDFAQYWEDMAKWTFGHPAIRRLNNERVLLTWYSGTPNCLSIHAAAIQVG
jgi:hypothetical protein